MTHLHFYLAVMALACLLIPSTVESSLHHATRRVMPTSTWKQTPSLFGLSAPLTSSHTAFVPSQSPGKVAIAGSIGLLGRLAFLSHFVHHSCIIDSPSSQSILHPRTPSCAARRHRISTFLSSKSRDDPGDNGDEEFDIQRLYQQVQEEDSEWFYKTFSKLLDEGLTEKNDRMGIMTKGSKSNNFDESSRESNLGLMSDNEEKFVVMADDGTKSKENLVESNQSDQRKAVETEALTPKDAIISVLRENVEPPPSSIGSERKHPPIMQQSRRETEEEDDQALKTTVQRARAFDDGTRNDDSKGGEKYKGGFDDDNEYEDLDSYDEDGYEDRAVPQPRRRQPPVSVSQERPRPKHPQTKPSGNVSPPPIVRLRNTYDGDIETLGLLADLLNIGYTEKEILVLRPQVLELIFEDRIPKPKKGLPKRWVRLSKLAGYKKEAEEDEDDEDFEWEVDVVSGKTLDEKVGSEDLDTKDSVGVKNDLIDDDKSSSVSKVKEQKSDAKKETSGDVSIPRESRSRSQQPKEGRVVESWGPFTSSRVPDNTDDEAAQYKTTTESGTRKKRQQPIKAEEDDNGDSRRYDDSERGSVYAKRFPKLQGRVSDYDDGDEDSPSYSSNPAPQKRQRQRPPARRRELVIDRGDEDEPPPNKFWMDLPTFRDFLRKEAQFRLQILGPDWKESVLDESRWRYDLYKTWLTMLDEGVGENPLYEYGDRPRGPAERRRSSPQPRSRGEQRRSRVPPEREFDEKDYDIDGGRPKRQNTRSEPRGEGSRRVEPRASFDRRPPPPRTSGTWKNFSDLENSLQRSSQERLKPERGSLDYRGDKVGAKTDYDESFDEEDDDAPGRKRRSTVRPQSENAKRGNDVPYDEEYDRSIKDERQDSTRRRSRVRSAPVRSQGQNSRKVETSSEQDYDESLED